MKRLVNLNASTSQKSKKSENSNNDSPVNFLKTENLELRQKEQIYNELQTRLMDLEHSMKVLKEYKSREEAEYKETEYIETKKIENLQEELKNLRNILLQYETDIKNFETESESYKKIISAKNSEIQALKNRISDILEEIASFGSEKHTLENENEILQKARDSAKVELEKLTSMNDRIRLNNKEDRKRINEQKIELSKIEENLSEILDQTNKVTQEIQEREILSKEAKGAQKANDSEIDSIIKEIGILQENTLNINTKISTADLQVKKTEQAILQANAEFEKLNQENKEMKNELEKLGSQTHENNEILKELEEEFSHMQELEHATRKDKDLQKSLLEQERQKREELEQEKQKYEGLLLAKELEFANNKREFDTFAKKYNELKENHMDLNNEVDAVNQHIKVLETQNGEVFL